MFLISELVTEYTYEFSMSSSSSFCSAANRGIAELVWFQCGPDRSLVMGAVTLNLDSTVSTRIQLETRYPFFDKITIQSGVVRARDNHNLYWKTINYLKFKSNLKVWELGEMQA